MPEYRAKQFLYGGDYNPDQWPREVWQDDIVKMKALGANAATVPVFSWAHLQPAEDNYNFKWLDEVLHLLIHNSINLILATPTAAHPAWMSRKYPEVLRADMHGLRRTHGARSNYCPNSPIYRKHAARMAAKMAERYASLPNLVLWHIGNEYGSYCYCDTCRAAFQAWLKQRYGSLDALNRAWYTPFWGHTLYAWEEVEVPSLQNEMFQYGEKLATTCQGMALDYNRFMSDSLLACYCNERDAIRAFTPRVPITTNLMGTFKPLDYFKWAKEMDLVTWDSYPRMIDPPSMPALRHDLTRGLKDGMPFLLMEQTPNQQNWQPVNMLKRPGVMRLLSYQAVAHGSDSVLFFQWRQTLGSCEKYHAAMVPHANTLDTRIGRELTQLGGELKRLDKVLGSRVEARVALVFDWPNWWAAEFSSGPTVYLKYLDMLGKYYQALFDLNVPLDIIPPDADLTKYDLVIAPLLYMCSQTNATRFEAFVERGGTFLTTFFSGWVDENDLVYEGGYPGVLRKLLGVWVEEQDALFPDMTNEMVFEADAPAELQGTYRCGNICEVAHSQGASVLARFGKDFYVGKPALTENAFGLGKALYVASDIEVELITRLVKVLCARHAIHPILETPAGVEVTQRCKDGHCYTFILNHNDSPAEVTLKAEQMDLISGQKFSGAVTLAPRDVLILES